MLGILADILLGSEASTSSELGLPDQEMSSMNLGAKYEAQRSSELPDVASAESVQAISEQAAYAEGQAKVLAQHSQAALRAGRAYAQIHATRAAHAQGRMQIDLQLKKTDLRYQNSVDMYNLGAGVQRAERRGFTHALQGAKGKLGF